MTLFTSKEISEILFVFFSLEILNCISPEVKKKTEQKTNKQTPNKQTQQKQHTVF